MSTGKSVGRKAFSALYKARREAARALQNFEKVQSEAYAQMGLRAEEFGTDRGRELLSIFRKRMDVLREIDKVSDEIRSLSRESGSQQRVTQLKSHRSDLYSALADLPELGYTEAEWRSVGESEKKKPIGKPKVRIEQHLCRAVDELEARNRDVVDIEKKEGAQPITTAELRELANEINQEKGGKRRLSNHARLNRDVVKLQAELAYYQSEIARNDYLKDLDDRMKRLGVSDLSQVPGRMPKTTDEHIESLVSGIAKMEAELESEIVAKEADDPQARIDSYIERQERAVREYTRLANKAERQEMKSLYESGLASAQAQLKEFESIKNKGGEVPVVATKEQDSVSPTTGELASRQLSSGKEDRIAASRNAHAARIQRGSNDLGSMLDDLLRSANIDASGEVDQQDSKPNLLARLMKVSNA